MGLIYADVLLENGDDRALFRNGNVGEEEIRQMTIHSLVDAGSIMLVINETIREALGLPVVGERRSQMADGSFVVLPVAGNVTVRYMDRFCTTNALVFDDDQEPLLGAIPMEEMDLYVHPGRNELLPLHPDGPIMTLK